MDRFILQAEENPYISGLQLNEYARGAYEAIRFEQWKNEDYKPIVICTSLEGIDKIVFAAGETYIPIGTIEFVEKVMQRHYHRSRLKPVNIPLALQNKNFYKRRTAYGAGADAVQQLYDDWNTDELFIKSASRVKADFTGIYKRGDSPIPYASEELILISEVLPMKTDKCSEWRAFVNHGKIVDIKNYAGNQWALPDKHLVEDMADATAAILQACTVDVMVTDTGDTALVEVHNFISCGLYGAELPLSMYKQSFLQELKRSQS